MEEDIYKKGNICWKRENKFYCILKYTVKKNGEVFIHFVTRDRNQILSPNGKTTNIDHISFHKDGKVHLKMKGGKRIKVPLKLNKTLWKIEDKVDVPILAISYYHEKFAEYCDKYVPIIEKDSIDFSFYTNKSFTIVFWLKDYGKTPKDLRELSFFVKYGVFNFENRKNPIAQKHIILGHIYKIVINPNIGSEGKSES